MARAKRQVQAEQVFELLRQLYPDATCALHHRNAWELLCATILSAQCTDERVNMTTPGLFQRFPNAEVMAAADPADVQDAIKSIGLFREKTKSLIAMSQDIVARFGGEVPRALEDLTSLRGVGRKTANVVIGVAFGGDAVVVDTHVRRLSQRLGWTTNDDPDKIERDLMALFPREHWTPLAHMLILHGRQVCDARKPLCPECTLNGICPEGRKRLAGG